MTTTQLDLTLRFFVENPDRYHELYDIVMFIRREEGKETDPSHVLLYVLKLAKEGLVDYRKEELYTGEPDPIFNVKKTYREDYMITYDGVQFYQNGGFASHEQRQKTKVEREEKKLATELEFIEQSKKMIPFQRKQTLITTFVAIVSLIFIAITTYQGCGDKTTTESKTPNQNVVDTTKH